MWTRDRLVKMRQPLTAEPRVDPRRRGILSNGTADAARSTHARYAPSPELAGWVERYWSVSWDYRGVAAERVEILAHPSVHMTFDWRGRAAVVGIMSGRFTRILKDRGGVFGVKFTPGGFHPFFRKQVASLANKRVALSVLFGHAGVDVARAMRAAADDGARVAIVERFLIERGARPDANVARVSSIVYDIAADRELLKVSDLARRFQVNRRRLERLFARYVGASPKWVIARYRLHEAAEQLANGEGRLADLAAALGYADQSHFVYDFKATVGRSPGAYAKAASR
jgi:AraC-like DNA-binding protein